MVDESGNLGLKERYFVLGMFNTPQREKAKRILKKFQKDYTKKEEIKGAHLRLPEKQELINRMKNIDYSVHYMVADKPNIILLQRNMDKNLVYNYLLTFIVEKVIKDNLTAPKLVFHLDNHTIKVKSLNSFADHIKLKAFACNYYGEIEVEYFDSHKHTLIQYADVVANVVYSKYEKNRSHLYNLFQNKIQTSYKFPLANFGQ